MISEELQKEATDLAEEITREAIGYFQKAVERSGIVLSGDLRNSFEYQIIQTAGQLSVAGVIEFRGYGRFKDMKVLNYLAPMPLEAIEEYVNKVGIHRFAYVPGYQYGEIPTTINVARRIARQIIQARKKVPVVRRKAQHTWYNRTKADFMNVMRRRMLDRAQTILLKAMKEAALG